MDAWIFVFYIGWTAAVFSTAWVLGSRSKEKSIRINGLEDVNAHYQKMAEDFARVDGDFDDVRSKLGGVRELPQGDGEVPKADGT